MARVSHIWVPLKETTDLVRDAPKWIRVVVLQQIPIRFEEQVEVAISVADE